MVQIFIFGSSSAYGVGGAKGGWGDLLKQRLHERMYSANGTGERCELYNFAKSGAKIDFVLRTFPAQLQEYGRQGTRKIAVASIGGNNMKAENQPDGFVSTLDEYEQQMTELLSGLKQNFNNVIFPSSGFVDETKTNPKFNPLTGGRSYFTNSRRKQFEGVLQKICKTTGVDFVDLGVTQEQWQKQYLSMDGLHPNQAGHEFIAAKLWERIEPLLG